jgi:endonuclease G
MPKSTLAWITIPLLGLISVLFLTIISPIVNAATSTHIVISEVQIAGVTASDEFVELYNPTSNDVSLNGWRLTRKTDTGSESNLVSSLSGTIKAHGYFLVTPQSGYTGSVAADETYSVAGSPIAANGTVLIYSDAGTTLIDKVGFGSAADKESTATSNPASSSSAERKGYYYHQRSG